MNDDHIIVLASSFEAVISFVYIQNISVFDWHDGKQILSSSGMKSPQPSVGSLGWKTVLSYFYSRCL